MDAMILAAGLGTRLRPLTHHTPKALVEVAGLPLLERVVRRVVDAGADRLVINVAHLGDQVAEYVDRADWAVDEVVVSEEPGGPYETGGGLKYAAGFFRRDAPFLMHNADILTDVDLAALYRAQSEATDGRLATLACRPADTDRYLLFDEAGLLGYAYDGEEHLKREAQGEPRRLDFCGVQACDPELIEAVEGVAEQKFSIMTTYLRLAGQGRHVAAFEGGGHTCLDVGTHERLEEAAAAVEAGRVR
jgi:NDP-sugar pyrophosphorylase family protein